MGGVSRRRTCTWTSLRQLAGDRFRHLFEEQDLHQGPRRHFFEEQEGAIWRGGAPQDLHQDLAEAAGRRLAPTSLRWPGRAAPTFL